MWLNFFYELSYFFYEFSYDDLKLKFFCDFNQYPGVSVI